MPTPYVLPSVTIFKWNRTLVPRQFYHTIKNDIRVQYHNVFTSKCILFIVLCLQNVSWLVFDRFTKIIGFSRTHRKSSEICLKCREKFLIIFRRTFRRTVVHSGRPAVFVFGRKPPELRQIILCDFTWKKPIHYPHEEPLDGNPIFFSSSYLHRGNSVHKIPNRVCLLNSS